MHVSENKQATVFIIDAIYHLELHCLSNLLRLLNFPF